jgi:hypothetical protein
MKYLLTVTAYADRDPSCNLYTYTETFDLGFERPSADLVKAHIEDVKERFTASWPHPRHRNPTLIPIDADIIDVHATEVHA